MANSSPWRASNAAARGHRPAVLASSLRMRSRAVETRRCASTWSGMFTSLSPQHRLGELLDTANEGHGVTDQLPAVRSAVALTHGFNGSWMLFHEKRRNVAA